MTAVDTQEGRSAIAVAGVRLEEANARARAIDEIADIIEEYVGTHD